MSEIINWLPLDIAPAVVELGKIKIGYLGEERTSKKGGTYRQPVKLDRFLVTGLGRGSDGRLNIDQELMADLIEEHGDSDGKLRSIPVFLLSDRPQDVLRSSHVLYDGRARLASCDGRTCTWYRSTSGDLLDQQTEMPCNGEHTKKPWKLFSTLSCVIASRLARLGGVYMLRTTSVITTRQLAGSIVQIASMTGGILTGIPLRLVVRPMQAAPDGRPTTIHVVHLELHARDVADVQRMALEQATVRAQHRSRIQAAQAAYAAALPPPGGEEPDEVAAICAEFLPPEPEESPGWAALGDATDGAIRGREEGEDAASEGQGRQADGSMDEGEAVPAVQGYDGREKDVDADAMV